MKKILKIIFRVLLVIIMLPVAGMLAVYLNYHLISFSVRNNIYQTGIQVPYRNQTLVLGAGNYEPGKWINHAFNHRMHTTAQLFFDNKTTRIIVSGMNVPGDYDEPAEMKEVLMDYGIPDTVIFADWGGTRTWTSVQRVQELFGADSIIIVSQHDHLERALFVANCLGIDAIGLEAEPSPKRNRYWTLREYLARVKCIFDCLSYKFSFS